MGKVKFKKGVVFKNDKSSNKQTGSDNIASLQDALTEQAKCDPCGCNDCICYETICNATTGELLIRYYTGDEGGPYTEVVEPFETGLANVKALYDAR
jgi:hypothetical protein